MEDQEKPDATITEFGEKKQHQHQHQQKPLKIDMNDLLGSDQDKPVPSIVVVQTNRQQRRKRQKERRLMNESSRNEKKNDDDDDTSPAAAFEDLSSVTDRELKDMIERNSKIYASIAWKLPDGGAKLKAKSEAFQAELERRKHCGSQEVSLLFFFPFLFHLLVLMA